MILWGFYGAVFHQLSSVLRQFLTGHLKVYLVADMFPLSSHSLHFYMFYLSLECQQLPSLIPITLPPPPPHPPTPCIFFLDLEYRQYSSSPTSLCYFLS